jgi:hypothetical protein
MLWGLAGALSVDRFEFLRDLLVSLGTLLLGETFQRASSRVDDYELLALQR